MCVMYAIHIKNICSCNCPFVPALLRPMTVPANPNPRSIYERGRKRNFIGEIADIAYDQIES